MTTDWVKPQCRYCGRFVPINKGKTIEITANKGYLNTHPDAPEKVYLCDQDECRSRLEKYKTFHWYASHKII